MMRTAWIVCGIAALVAVSGRAESTDSDRLARADHLLRQGRFAEAEEIYRGLLLERDSDPDLLRRVGSLALWENRLGEAVVLLGDSLAVEANSVETLELLAEAHTRRSSFGVAAKLLARQGRRIRAAQLTSFGGQQPYALSSAPGRTEIAFVRTDPLPVIRIRVNGSEPVYALIDTGGSELLLDPEFAAEIGAQVFGAETAAFAAGKEADVQLATVDSVELGDLQIDRIPVGLLPTRRFSAAAGGLQIDGIVGTTLLSRFRFTLDYPRHRLVLEPRGVEGSRVGMQMPIWMAGDHFILTWGRVNDSPPVLLLVDTGLAGGGFVGAESFLKETGIDLGGESFEGVGGGGTVTVTPFVVERLAVGEAVQTGITGFAGVFPAELEHRFGFRIAGIVSHQFFRPYAATFDLDGMTLTLVEGQ